MLHFIRALAAAVAAGSVLVAPASAEDSGGVWTPNPDFTLEIHGSHRTRFEAIDDRYAIHHTLYASPRLTIVFLGSGDEPPIQLNAGLIAPVDPGAVLPSFASYTYRNPVASLRTSLTLDAQYKFFRLGAELMDSRAYALGSHCPPTVGFPVFSSCAQYASIFPLGDAEPLRNAVEPIQLFAGLSFGEERTGGPEFELIGGRFTLDIGSGRLVGRDTFRNTADSFLGGKAVWRSEDFKLTAFYTRPFIIPERGGNGIDFDDLREYEVLSSGIFGGTRQSAPDHHFWGAHVEFPEVFGHTSVEAFIYGRRVTKHFHPGFFNFFGREFDESRQQFTPGLRIVRPVFPGGISFDIEGAAQINTRPTQRAFFGHAELGYLSGSAWSPHISLLFDIASGSSARVESICNIPGDPCGFFSNFVENVAPFDPLYGRRDLDFGPTGIFSVLDRSNLISPGIRFAAAPTPNLDLNFTYRYARQLKSTKVGARFVFGPNFLPDSLEAQQIGHLLDASIHYRPGGGHVAIEVGGAALIGGTDTQGPCVTNFYCGGDNVMPYGYASISADF